MYNKRKNIKIGLGQSLLYLSKLSRKQKTNPKVFTKPYKNCEKLKENIKSN